MRQMLFFGHAGWVQIARETASKPRKSKFKHKGVIFFLVGALFPTQAPNALAQGRPSAWRCTHKHRPGRQKQGKRPPARYFSRRPIRRQLCCKRGVCWLDNTKPPITKQRSRHSDGLPPASALRSTVIPKRSLDCPHISLIEHPRKNEHQQQHHQHILPDQALTRGE